MCKIDGERGASVQHMELSSVLCDDLEGWGGGWWDGGPRGRAYKYTDS